MKLYHATSHAAATAIGVEGFRDGVDSQTGETGVWFADVPVVDFGTVGRSDDATTVLVIDVPEDVMTPYAKPESVVEVWNPTLQAWTATADRFRAFCLPARLVNQYPILSLTRLNSTIPNSGG
jgi:hypothetical protein